MAFQPVQLIIGSMERLKIDLSATGRTRVFLVSGLVTLGSIAVSTVLANTGVIPYDTAHLGQYLFVTVGVPIMMSLPVMYFLMSKLRDLALAHERLTVYASTDPLTQVMNRAAFSTLVEAYLDEVRGPQRKPAGALLIVDADHFKSINDHFGHDRGDEALVTIAQTIRNTLHSPEIVGRLGGEEFGVFLPDANRARANIVAERIRQSVADAPFAPNGAAHPLSVSVGGAVFDRPLGLGDLFRAADALLYAAKRGGRNRVVVQPVDMDALTAAA